MTGASRARAWWPREFLRALTASALAFAGSESFLPELARAEPADTIAAQAQRPFVAGGYDDKPYLTGLFGRIAVGGYAEFQAVWEREDGVTDEAGFLLKRWDLLVFTRVSDRVQVWAGVEFEDGGEEIALELAQLDFTLHPVFNLRGGMLLLPLGRFNLAHDGPRNEFTDRPLLATDLLGSALFMPGLGAFGRFSGGSRASATYEFYGVNGYGPGIVDSPEGTRLPAGRGNFEDNNASASLVGRVAWSIGEEHELGLSGYTGAYNTYRIEGLDVDERRTVRIGAIDARVRLLGLDWNGEAANVEVEIPPGLAGIYASRQAGFFIETRREFGRSWIPAMPGSSFSAALRAEGVDFDRDLAGDSHRQLTYGIHFRPTQESVLKLDYARGRSRDRFNNPVEGAALKFSMTSYF
jgi:hypothetical protein